MVSAIVQAIGAQVSAVHLHDDGIEPVLSRLVVLFQGRAEYSSTHLPWVAKRAVADLNEHQLFDIGLANP